MQDKDSEQAPLTSVGAKQKQSGLAAWRRWTVCPVADPASCLSGEAFWGYSVSAEAWEVEVGLSPAS